MKDKNKSTTSSSSNANVRVLKLGDAQRQAETFAPGSLTLDALQGFIASVATLEKPAQAEVQDECRDDSDQPAARVSSLNALMPKPDSGSGTTNRTGLSLATPSGDQPVVAGTVQDRTAQIQSFPGPARPKPRTD